MNEVVAHHKVYEQSIGDSPMSADMTITDWTGYGYNIMLEVTRYQGDHVSSASYTILDRTDIIELRDHLTTWLEATG